MKLNRRWTGERLETFVSGETAIEHLHRYALALEYVKGKRVLDIACGEGYGTNLLADHAFFVTGVDIDDNTILEARRKYTKKNIEFFKGDAAIIPLDDESVDVVVSFETIEHHDKHNEMLSEIKRVLKPEGVLIMSSPDKRYYSDETGHNNPFHIKELYYKEFKGLIETYFSQSQFIFQTMFCGSIFFSESDRSVGNIYKGNFDGIKNAGGINGVYNICIASDSNLKPVNISYFDGWEVLIDRKTHSITYRVGEIVLLPAKFILNLFSNRKRH